MQKVFLCHSSADKDFVRRLAKDLEKETINVWIDEKEILVGDQIRPKVEEGLNASDYLIIVLSPDSVTSPWVERELDAKMIEEIESRKVTVLPLLHRDCDIPPLLKGKHYADFRSDYQRGLRELVARFKHGDKEQEVKQKVLRRLATADPYRLDPHTLVVLAIQARDVDAAEELISAHQESIPACKQMDLFKTMLAHTRFLSSRDVNDFITALNLAFQLVAHHASQQNLQNLQGICSSAPNDPAAVNRLVQLLEHCLQITGRSPTHPWPLLCATSFLIGIHRSSLTQEKVVSACNTACQIVEITSPALLRPSLGSLTHVCTHLAARIETDDQRLEILTRIVDVASPKVGDTRDYADAFLHLAWAAAQTEDMEVAKRLLTKYKLTATAEEFERKTLHHPPLESLALAT
ncbi:MAG: toll/interleukin-1 receptor domain-containing protein [Phycisphaerales bacterium]